ncbi:hypothetical protein [Paenibacillus turpanensis]|uniref:hypothetical protein n=1 Tax=Paenibacillus turpanensis TaxID=2689078 RepID=UPI00140C29A1|nr:hypothetical protein [Paenibacillus turpanensis]
MTKNHSAADKNLQNVVDDLNHASPVALENQQIQQDKNDRRRYAQKNHDDKRDQHLARH